MSSIRSGQTAVPRRHASAGSPSSHLSSRSNSILLVFCALVIISMVPLVLWEMPHATEFSLSNPLHHGVDKVLQRIDPSFGHVKHEKRSRPTDQKRGGARRGPGDSQARGDKQSGTSQKLRTPDDKEAADVRKQQKNSAGRGVVISPDFAEDRDDTAHEDEDEAKKKDRPLARGVSGLPMVATPALIEAQRGHIECDADVDFLAYWNDPQGIYDRTFVSPFAEPKDVRNVKYLTFEPDSGGWNNIRMSLEIIVVFALATGRTLVLPPDQPFYRLTGDKQRKQRGLADFYPLDKWRGRISVISTEEFLRKEGGSDGRSPVDEEERAVVFGAANVCEFRAKSDISCFALNDHLRKVGFVPQFEADANCLIFDRDYVAGSALDDEKQELIKRFCGSARKPVYYDTTWSEAPVIHFAASSKEHRLLNHFYATMLFTDPAVDNYFKRFVRDFMRYKDEIFCAAGKIIRSIQNDGKKLGFTRDKEGAGRYSSLHVRRGELQYKRVKIPAEEWLENTKELWKENEILYIATDERDKSFFKPLSEKFDVRFLDNYWDYAKLGDLDPNYMGMIDTIVASRGRIFVGTWFSTFTGYINRMRGYHGMTMKDSYYGTLDRKYVLHEWADPDGNYFAREWQVGWVGIDGDDWVKGERHRQEDKVNRSVARGVSGLKLTQTPAVIGAKPGHVECDVNVDDLVYWNDPQGRKDADFLPPFAVNERGKQYLTFEPDSGGWNNIRMSLEIVIVIAAATGRTLVLPPESPLYLLTLDKSKKQRGFADFFPIHTEKFTRRVPVISTEEFLRREGGPNGVIPIPDEKKEAIWKVQKECVRRAKDPLYCGPLFDFLRESGVVPELSQGNCLVFDETVFRGGDITSDGQKHVQEFCNQRSVVFYEGALRNAPLLHFATSERQHRLLFHFYTFLAFTNPEYDNYYKRFVRDFMHYHDPIFCAAGKIVRALEKEGQQKGFYGAGYSSMHVRRGDLQYKQVKISATEWYSNLQDTWIPEELIYIATDERNKTFFDPIANHHELRFLDDFKELAGLEDLDPNYMGMIDTIVASRGRVFAGTYWSTFSGYINRLRGYYGMTMKDSYYGTKQHKTTMHTWDGSFGAGWQKEYPDGWVGIDGDKWPTKDKY